MQRPPGLTYLPKVSIEGSLRLPEFPCQADKSQERTQLPSCPRMSVFELGPILAYERDPGLRSFEGYWLILQSRMLGDPDPGMLFRPEEIHVLSGEGQVIKPPGDWDP